MVVKVNGNKIDYVKGETVSELLERMNYNFPLVVVKVNGKVVPHDRFPKSKVPDRSRVEVIHLISGG
jgi:thiamine biosynthesis protein ThiS